MGIHDMNTIGEAFLPSSMEESFEDIAFLATSRNRVGVLKALAEGSRDRYDLQAELGISQPTASRILRDLQDREWIVRVGTEYELTRVGRLTIGAFTDLQEQLEAVHHLSGVAALLPDEGFDFNLAQLRTADVVRIEEGEGGLARTHENAHLARLTVYASSLHSLRGRVWRRLGNRSRRKARGSSWLLRRILSRLSGPTQISRGGTER